MLKKVEVKSLFGNGEYAGAIYKLHESDTAMAFDVALDNPCHVHHYGFNDKRDVIGVYFSDGLGNLEVIEFTFDSEWRYFSAEISKNHCVILFVKSNNVESELIWERKE